MVSLNLDLYHYREELKRALLRRKTELEAEWDPFVAAWLAYGLLQDGSAGNPPLTELIERLTRWVRESRPWEQRHLGPIAILFYLRPEKDAMLQQAIERVIHHLEACDLHNKFSVLRDPEQVFLVGLGLAQAASEEVTRRFCSLFRSQLVGPLKRRVLFAAAIRELGEDPGDFGPWQPVMDVADVIAALWWIQRYTSEGDFTWRERQAWWTHFENVKDSVVLSGEPWADDQRVLSAAELAMLYEVISRETNAPDPRRLFTIYPLHNRIREIAGPHFYQGLYSTAVEQAAKALNELIQQKSKVFDKSESELVQATMGPQNPKIKFNAFLNEPSGKNEQTGLQRIADGVFRAFRNPKGHKPGDHPLAAVEPCEALDQLVIISYLMKRVEQAWGPGGA